MFMLTSSLERAALAAVALVLSVSTLVAATVLPMKAEPSTVTAKLKPTVETVLLSYEPALRTTRVN